MPSAWKIPTRASELRPPASGEAADELRAHERPMQFQQSARAGRDGCALCSVVPFVAVRSERALTPTARIASIRLPSPRELKTSVFDGELVRYHGVSISLVLVSIETLYALREQPNRKMASWFGWSPIVRGNRIAHVL